ncbi:hypothetical protein [Teredinibacter turnerae]|uniref:hypothetical protein n=1 Tax=Teredinibacter turnerae TaxID=2426 RepID=UPI0005F889C4|nr:hypothetical protein [Teredinibacter turnerae]
MKGRFEELKNKNGEFVGIKHGAHWWETIIVDVLNAYDKLLPTKEYLVEDPLSRITRLTKRNLLIFSTLLLLMSIYGVSNSDANVFGMTLKNKELYILEGAFGMVVGYQFISFIFHYWRDLGRLFQAKIGLVHESLVYPLYLIQNHLAQIECSKAQDDPNIERMIENTKNYANFVNKVSISYLKVKTITTINTIRFVCEVIVWDLLIPSIMALIAISMVWTSINNIFIDFANKIYS